MSAGLAINPKTISMNISLEQAEAAIKAAKEKAKQIGVPMNIAIIDSGANLVAFARMDDAWLGSIDIALRKAKTARYFNMESGEIGKLSQPGAQAWQIEHSNGGLITFPGGIPITNGKDQVVGAIGASGGTVENDREVALAGANAVK